MATFNQLQPRCRVVAYLGNNLAVFECLEHGHTFKAKVMPKAPNGKLPSEDMIKRMAHWWRGGVIMDCPRCRAGHELEA